MQTDHAEAWKGRLAIAMLGILIATPAGQVPGGDLAELPRLWHRLSQVGVVDNVQLPIENNRLDGARGDAWINKVEKLRASLAPAPRPPLPPKKAKWPPPPGAMPLARRNLAATAPKLQPVIDLRKQARAIEDKYEQIREELRTKAAPEINRFTKLLEVMEEPGDSQLEEIVNQGTISRQGADARIRRRSEVWSALSRQLSQDLKTTTWRTLPPCRNSTICKTAPRCSAMRWYRRPCFQSCGSRPAPNRSRCPSTHQAVKAASKYLTLRS